MKYTLFFHTNDMANRAEDVLTEHGGIRENNMNIIIFDGTHEEYKVINDLLDQNLGAQPKKWMFICTPSA